MTRKWRTTDSFAAILLLSMATVAAAAESQAPNCTNTTQIDLCFLIDRSGSICDADPKFNFSNPADTTCDNWAFVVNFVYRFVTDLYIGPSDVRVAVVIFDNSAHLMWNLTRYLDKGVLLEAINTTLGYEKGQTTNTSDGLNLMADQVFNAAVRPGALRTAIIITDGKPTNVSDAFEAVDRVHSRNITTFVVGVTTQIDEATLKRLSSPPQEQGYTYFIADTYSSIDTVRSQVLSQTCLRPTTTTLSTTPTTTTTTTPKTTNPNPNATSYTNALPNTPDPKISNPSSVRSTPHYTPTISTDFNPYISGLTSTSSRTPNDTGTLSTTSNPNLSIPSTRNPNDNGTLSTTSNPNLSIPSTRNPNDNGTLSTTSNSNLSIPSTGSGNSVPNNYSAVPNTPPGTIHNSSSWSTNSLNANTASVPSVIAGNTNEPNGGGALTDGSGVAHSSSRATTPGPPGPKTTEMTTSTPRDDGFTFANVGPLRGPIAGGTAVTISGSWPADNVSVTAVYIGGGIRGIVTEVNRLWGNDEILFLTPPTDQVGNLLLEVQFSGYYPDPENYTTFNVSTDRYFAYSDNPRIWEVFPREHLVSGGTMLTAVGSNLTSIGYAAIQAMVEVCRFSGNGKPPACSRTSRTRPCVSSAVVNKPYPTELICKMPQIDLPPDFLDILDNVTIPSNVTLNFTQRAKRDLDSTSSIHSRRKRSTTTPGSVQSLTGSNGKDTADIYLRFILDGFQGNELTTILQDTRFYFFSAPEITSSHAVVSFNPDEEMTIPIQGKHMQRGCTREDYMVRLGKSNCTITILTDNQLTCSPPEVQPENTNEFDYKFCDLRYTIIVSIGDKIYFYRCLEYTGPNSPPLGCPADCWNNSNCWWKWKRIVIIVGLVIGLVLLLLIIILIICLIVTCRRYRRQRRMEAAVSRGRNQMRAMGAVDGSIGGNHAALNGAKSSRGSISMEYLTSAADEDNEDADRISTGSSVKADD